jgi:hypothetical protein
MARMDGSHHDWLEGRGPKRVLMGYIDDATNTAHGRFYDHEGTFPAFDGFRRYARRYGIPASVYVDRHGTYKALRELTADAHRRAPRDLDAVLCIKTERRLNNDATMAHGGKCYQIEDKVRSRTLVVEERLDGSLRIRHRDAALKYRELPARPRRRLLPGVKSGRRKYKPPANHPWRKLVRRPTDGGSGIPAVR